MKDPVPPFAPARADFPCPALLACAARASLGGAREALLGTIMAVRLASGLVPGIAVAREARALRAEGARVWLTALTLPAKARSALLRAYAATAGDDPHAAADALALVTEVTDNHLDRGSRAELTRLAATLRDVSGAIAALRT